MFLRPRIGHAKLGRAGDELPREGEVRERGAEEVVRRTPAEILGIDLVVVERDEVPGFLGGGALQAARGQIEDGGKAGIGGAGGGHGDLVVVVAPPPTGAPLVGSATRGRRDAPFSPIPRGRGYRVAV